MLELFIDNKKSLTIRKSPILKSSEMLKISFGTPENFNIRIYLRELSRIDLEELKEFYEFIKKC